MLSIKQLPIDLLSDKNLFQHFDKCPFYPTSNKYMSANAAWLAETCRAAYLSQQSGKTVLMQAFSKYKNCTVDYHVGKNKGANFFIITTDHFRIIAFRGSETNFEDGMSSPISDWFDTDLDIALINTIYWPSNVKVHKGFLQAFAEVKTVVENYINTNVPVWLTGHSLGGAMATLTLAYFNEKPSLKGMYNFGTPRVGNNHFAQLLLRKPSFRIVNDKDIIVRLPTSDYIPFSDSFGTKYLHHSNGIYIGQAGDCLSFAESDLLFDFNMKVFNLFSSATNVLKNIASQIAPEAISDHAIVAYSTYLWNNWVKDETRTQ